MIETARNWKQSFVFSQKEGGTQANAHKQIKPPCFVALEDAVNSPGEVKFEKMASFELACFLGMAKAKRTLSQTEIQIPSLLTRCE